MAYPNFLDKVKQLIGGVPSSLNQIGSSVANNATQSFNNSAPVQGFKMYQGMARSPQVQSFAKQAFSSNNIAKTMVGGMQYLPGGAPLQNPEVKKIAIPYMENRYVKPVQNIPNAWNQAFNKKSDLATRGQGALGLVGGAFSLIPDPIGDVAMPIYDAYKGLSKARLENQSYPQTIDTITKSLTWEKPVGLGDAFSKDPQKQMIGNLGELPLMIGLTGKLNKKFNAGFTKNQIAAIQNFTPEDRTIIGRFAQLVETGKGKNNLGELGETIHSMAGNLFGQKNTANMTSKQLKNLFDLALKVADSRGKIKEPFSIGFNAQDVRKTLDQTTSPLPLKNVAGESGGVVKQGLQKLQSTKPQVGTDLSIKLPTKEGMAMQAPVQLPKVSGSQLGDQVKTSLNKSIPELQPKTQLLNKIDELKQSAQQSLQEQKAISQSKSQQLERLSSNDLKDLSTLRKMVNSKSGQAGDMETLYQKDTKLMDRVLNRMREVTGDYQGTAKTDVELLDHALSLPTKGSLKIQQPPEIKQIKALKEEAAIAKDLVYHAEPIKRPQSQAQMFDKDLKEWSSMVYKDAVKSEKANTIDAVNKLVSNIETSTTNKLKQTFVTNGDGKIIKSKSGEGLKRALLDSSTEWKDKPKVSYIRETMDRNFEDVMGKQAPKMKEVFLDPIKSSEAERIRFLNKERASIKDLGIKARSKESGLVQQFGEKKLSAEQVLEQVKGDSKKADQIINASNVLRKKYDTYLTDINKVLTRNGYDPIPKRDDYFTHFQEVSSALERFGIPVRDNKLPTDINGLTADFKPGKNFFSNALPRLGDKTDIDAITGIDRYLEGASQQMYHTDNIQRLRLLENSIRAKYEGTTHLSNFVTELSEYANGIAGKKHMIDRAAEAMVGRNIYGASNRLKSQVGANMVGANVSSALTNFIPLTQSLATTNKKSFVKGMMSTIGNVFKNDGFVDRSDFLTKRFGSDKLSMNLWDKSAQKAGWLFKAIDQFTSSTIVRSKFDEGVKMGLAPSKAMARADSWANKVIGGRSVGDMPTLFNSKTLGLFTQFQLEVNNQLSFMAKDIPRNFDKKGAAAALGQVFLYSYLFNNLYEKAVGRRPAFDPVGVAVDSYQDFNNPDMKKGQAAKNTLGRVAQTLPFSSIIEGGRIPVGSAIPDVPALIKGESDLKSELMKPAYYVLPPFGGGQIKKTVEGLDAYNKQYSESKTGRVRFPIEQGVGSALKSGVFGQWSGENAKKYLREGQSVLGEDQSATFKASSGEARQSFYDNTLSERKTNKQIEKQEEEYKKTGEISKVEAPGGAPIEIKDKVIKSNLNNSSQRIEILNNRLYVKSDDDKSIKTFDLAPQTYTGNAIQQAQQKAKHDSQIQSIGTSTYFSTKLSDGDKGRIYKELGTTASDVEFKALTSIKDEEQAPILFQLLQDRNWDVKKVETFIDKEVLTNSVVDKMENQGLITETQAKTLKNHIKAVNVKLGKAKAGKGKKGKKISIAKLKVGSVKRINIKMKVPKMPKIKKMSKNQLTFKSKGSTMRVKV